MPSEKSKADKAKPELNLRHSKLKAAEAALLAGELNKPSWESKNEGIHERVSFEDSIWGFDLAGGSFYKTPLRVTSVKADSRADKAGIRPGDRLLRINDIDTSTLTIQEAHEIIIESGIHLRIAVTAPDDLEDSYNCWQDEIDRGYDSEEERRKEEERAKKREVHAKVSSYWSLQWPWVSKRRVIYRESNCFMVPSKFESKHRDKFPEQHAFGPKVLDDIVLHSNNPTQDKNSKENPKDAETNKPNTPTNVNTETNLLQTTTTASENENIKEKETEKNVKNFVSDLIQSNAPNNKNNDVLPDKLEENSQDTSNIDASKSESIEQNTKKNDLTESDLSIGAEQDNEASEAHETETDATENEVSHIEEPTSEEPSKVEDAENELSERQETENGTTNTELESETTDDQESILTVDEIIDQVLENCDVKNDDEENVINEILSESDAQNSISFDENSR